MRVKFAVDSARGERLLQGSRPGGKRIVRAAAVEIDRKRVHAVRPGVAAQLVCVGWIERKPTLEMIAGEVAVSQRGTVCANFAEELRLMQPDLQCKKPAHREAADVAPFGSGARAVVRVNVWNQLFAEEPLHSAWPADAVRHVRLDGFRVVISRHGKYHDHGRKIAACDPCVGAVARASIVEPPGRGRAVAVHRIPYGVFLRRRVAGGQVDEERDGCVHRRAMEHEVVGFALPKRGWHGGRHRSRWRRRAARADKQNRDNQHRADGAKNAAPIRALIE